MVYQATRAIHAHLSRTTMLNVYIEENDQFSTVCLDQSTQYGSQYTIRFISQDEDNDVAVRVFDLLSVKEKYRGKVLTVLNALNNRCRYVKFTLDQDDSVTAAYDYTVPTIHPANSAEEMIGHFTRIIDEAYPELMKALWSD